MNQPPTTPPRVGTYVDVGVAFAALGVQGAARRANILRELDVPTFRVGGVDFVDEAELTAALQRRRGAALPPPPPTATSQALDLAKLRQDVLDEFAAFDERNRIAAAQIAKLRQQVEKLLAARAAKSAPNEQPQPQPKRSKR
jgi:hypothetical protein